MENYLLVTLMLILLINYLSFNDILEPSFLFTMPFLISLCIYIVFRSVDNYFSLVTFTVVVGASFAVYLGALFAKFLFSKKDFANKDYRAMELVISDRWLLFASIIFLTITFGAYYRYIVTTSDISLIFAEGSLTEFREVSSTTPFYLDFMIKSAVAFGYFFLYQFLSCYLVKGEKRYSLLIPVILYILIYIIGSSRIEFLDFVFSTLIMFFLINHKTKTVSFFNLLKWSVIAVVLCSLIFYLLGYLTGKSSETTDFTQILLLYGGSSIPALNHFLTEFDYSITNFGTETLISLKPVLSFLGIDTAQINRHLEYVLLEGMSSRTNIYTSLRRLLVDYNYWGMG